MGLFKRNKILRTPEAKKKKEKENRIKLAFFIAIAIILIGGPIYLLRLDQFLIKSIRIEGTNVTPEEEVEKVISSHLEGNYLWVLPKSNALLYPKKALTLELLRQIPRLSLVSVSLVSNEELKVKVVEREPFALYCREVIAEGSILPEDCFFIDKNGFIFAEAPAFSGDVYTIFTQGDIIENPIGRMYMPESNFRDIASLISELRLFGVHSRVFSVDKDEYHLYLPNTGKIMWKSSQDINQTYNNLTSFLSDKSIAGDKSFLDKILYLDMRFGNKIFYKFRQ